MSNEFKAYCEDNGIERHFTAPYTPQQNGVVERRNRTVVEMTRCFLKEMGLPATLWGEAVRHSVYVLNRLPTRALSNQTPYEAWTGKKPNLGHIRVFGCLTHMKIPDVHTKKLDDRSMQVFNLGREPGTKAYRVYDPVSKRIYVSRDVVFEETKGWSFLQLETNDEGTFSVPDEFVQTVENSGEIEQVDDSDNWEGGYETPSRSAMSGTSEAESVVSSRSSVHGSSETEGSNISSHRYDDSGEPLRYRSIQDVYENTEEIELEQELLFAGTEEPQSYKQAAGDKNWRLAMEGEINSIEKNGTWKLTELPVGKKVIDLKWVYKIKKNADGEVIKYKARLVAKGYVQEHGIDYEEVFAPVTRLETVRLLLALAAKNGWQVHHLDVKTAFLNGDISEEVYVSQPMGFVKNGQEKLVYKLFKALYGLKQAPRAWYAKLNSCLEKLGFKRCPSEQAVYTRRDCEGVLIIGVYVDDILVTGTKGSSIELFKKQMSQVFEMSDLGWLAYYLGIKVKQGDGYIELRQSGYAKKLLEQAGMGECNATKYPMDPSEQLVKDVGGKEVDSTKYRSLVGGLRYLVHTRPDIAFSVGMVSRYMEHPTVLHLNAVKRILRYVKGTVEFGLVYSKVSGNNVLTGFSDSDLAGHVEDRRSTSGMAFYLNESLITWVSQKQKCVALSSCEAEFMAATAAACQSIWLRNVLQQVTKEEIGPVVLYIDNKSAIDLAKNPVFHGRSKHIDVRYHFIRECIERGEITVKHVSSEYQRADILTKALTTVKFERMRQLLGVKEMAVRV